MKHTIDYEFNIALAGINEVLNEEYYDTVGYRYEIPEDKLKQVILDVVCWAYNFDEEVKEQFEKFIDNHDMWEELLDEYEYEIDDILFDDCYDEAETEFMMYKGD